MRCVAVSKEEAEAQAGMTWLDKWRLPHLHSVSENTDPVCRGAGWGWYCLHMCLGAERGFSL